MAKRSVCEVCGEPATFLMNVADSPDSPFRRCEPRCVQHGAPFAGGAPVTYPANYVASAAPAPERHAVNDPVYESVIGEARYFDDPLLVIWRDDGTSVCVTKLPGCEQFDGKRVRLTIEVEESPNSPPTTVR